MTIAMNATEKFVNFENEHWIVMDSMVIIMIIIVIFLLWHYSKESGGVKK